MKNDKYIDRRHMINRAISEDSELIKNTISYRKPMKRLKISNRVGCFIARAEDSSSKQVLYSLELGKVILRCTMEKRVRIIKARSNDGTAYCFSSVNIEAGAYTT